MMAAHSNYPLPQATGPPSQPFPSLPQQQQQQQQLQYSHPQLQQRYPPQQQQQQQQVQSYPQLQDQHQAQARPTAERTRSRAFSFRSDKSQKSAGSHQQLTETHAEKEAKRLHSKADPTLAMNEAEPAAVAQTVRTSLASLRSMSHRDTYGNTISDPDRSNPTRSRWERPLDTIRSFEAAIDGGYNRKSFIRSDAESIANWNRRSSYYGNNGAARFPQDSYYGGRPNSMMPSSSQFDLRQGTPGRESYVDQGQAPNAYSNGTGAARQRYSRIASEPQFSSAYKQSEGQGVYPLPNNHRSYETVGSASGSGSSGEPAGYQTDPTSSDNSSIERVQSPAKKKPEPMNDYGIGFSQTASYQPSAFTIGVKSPRTSPRGPGPAPAPGPALQPNGFQPGPPPVPRKDGSNNNVIARKPMGQPLPDPTATQQQQQQQQQQRPAMGEKRKSWFARRFSKQG